MVAFKNPIVFFLVIPSGATSGQRVVIDGVNGVIDVFNSNNVKTIEIGQGVIQIFSTTSTMQISDTVDGAAIQFWLNANPSNIGSLSMDNIGNVRILGLKFVSGDTGNTVFPDIFVGNTITAEFVNASTSAIEGANLLMSTNKFQLSPKIDDPSVSGQLQITLHKPSGIAVIENSVSGGFKSITLNAAWSNNAGNSTCATQLMADGSIQMRGVAIYGGVAASSGTFGTLSDANHFPLTIKDFPGRLLATGGIIFMSTAGVITWSTTANIAAGQAIYLDGLRYDGPALT